MVARRVLSKISCPVRIMPPSATSAKHRIPDIRYGRLYLAAFVLVCMLGTGFELFFRAHDYLPNITDSERFWSLHRADVYAKDGRERLVVIGASRGQLIMDPDLLEQYLPDYKVKQLTLIGAPAYEVLRDLCEDPEFTGVIVWTALARYLMPTHNPDHLDAVCTRFYHEHGYELDKNLNCMISAWLQSHLVILSSDLALRFLFDNHFEWRASFMNLNIRRYRPARFDIESGQTAARENQEHYRDFDFSQFEMMDPEAYLRFLEDDLVPLYQQLRARGGKLVILRMPVTGGLKRLNDIICPRPLFWDQIEPRTSIPTIHYADYPGLTGFECPDASHMDVSDVPEFVRNLVPILKSKLNEQDGREANVNE